MQIATWNVNSLRVRIDHLRQWLADHPVDAFALQELKLPDEQFPADAIRALGYSAVHFGQKTYNGVAILSREPLSDVVMGMPGDDDDPQRRVIAATVGGVRIVERLRAERPGGRFREVRLQAGLARAAARLPRGAARRAIRACWSSATSTSRPRTATCTTRPPGRARCTSARPSGRRCAKIERSASRTCSGSSTSRRRRIHWWDYRMGAFRRNNGLRIDLMLASPAWPPPARPARSTARPAAGSGHPTTRRSWPRLT